MAKPPPPRCADVDFRRSLLSPWFFSGGGVPENWRVGAVATNPTARPQQPQSVFVIEADEYDTASFDKRSKFVHYHPRTAILKQSYSIMQTSSPI